MTNCRPPPLSKERIERRADLCYAGSDTQSGEAVDSSRHAAGSPDTSAKMLVPAGLDPFVDCSQPSVVGEVI